ncbi:2-phospho-L-lactate guanylyltransferase [Agromyces sp. MMS24-JH15]|uniref:2-phospho-L-lactate guanylyltransferase n=1 Tax=Agromyces sp. MMS24-JH15 TaxID=3243765 RepID=UPI003749520C
MTADAQPAAVVEERPTGSDASRDPDWTVVIPVKAPTRAKTRLAPDLDPAARERLAAAFAVDTFAAAVGAAGVRRVLVVGEADATRRAAEAAGAEYVAESGGTGLRAAIADGVRAAGPGDVAVLLGDLPCLRSEDLADALADAAGHPLAFVRDADGTGTTLATARAGVGFAAHFGDGSAARHAEAGFVELGASSSSSWTSLRRDVDTAAALAEAVALGVGPATTAALAG